MKLGQLTYKNTIFCPRLERLNHTFVACGNELTKSSVHELIVGLEVGECGLSDAQRTQQSQNNSNTLYLGNVCTVKPL